MHQSKYKLNLLLPLIFLGISLFNPSIVMATHLKIIQQSFITPEMGNFDVHGATITEVKPGVLMAAWYGGETNTQVSVDKKAQTQIWFSMYSNGRWSDRKLLASCGANNKSWNPVLYTLPSQEIVLFYRCGESPRNWVSVMRVSKNEGKSWSNPIILPAGITGPVRNKPLYLKNERRMVCPSSIELGEESTEYKSSAAWVDVTDDLGKTWHKYGPITFTHSSFGLIEPTIVLSPDKTLLMLMRDRSAELNQKGFIWFSESKDLGKTWTHATKTNLPNPDSAVDAISLSSGAYLLAYNHSNIERSPLSLAISKDGKEWIPLFNLENGVGEYSFPAIIQAQNGEIHIVYSYAKGNNSLRRIKHVVLAEQS